jgi:cytochrome c
VLKISTALVVCMLSLVVSLSAQTPTFGLGHTARTDAVNAIDIEVLPDGQGLPPGSGAADAGRAVYVAHCSACHGPTGTEGPNDVLVGGQGSLTTARPLKTVGSFWPYATTVWDYINRAMPFDEPGLLKPPEVYAVTAYILNINGIIADDTVIDARSLPKVRMPNRDGFVADPRPDVGRK